MHSQPESTTQTIGAPLGGAPARDGSGAPGSFTQAEAVIHADVLSGLVKTLRPHQWVKNLFVLAPIVFSKDVLLHTSQGPALNLLVAGRVLAATGVFCLLAGAVYTMNDLADVAADRLHPVKRDRPIASGLVPEGIARGAAAALVLVSLAAAYFIAPAFALVALVYFAENVAYSSKLKKVAFLDVGLLAFGFVLRVLGGGIAANVRVSSYMIACTALLALFLGFGKRRHEVSLESAAKHRAALDVYTPRSLNVALAVTGFATLATYVAYTLDPATRAFFNSNHLWLTTPFTAYGIFRFLKLVRGQAGRGLKAESPTQEMLRDVPFVLNLVLWIAVVIAVVYHLRPN
ncbi:MAG TPA: UbiA prenyltransferase family protein [Polyangiaceae bacterium]|jgi:4-hydroxybenzoate polyprenyltransferase